MASSCQLYIGVVYCSLKYFLHGFCIMVIQYSDLWVVLISVSIKFDDEFGFNQFLVDATDAVAPFFCVIQSSGYRKTRAIVEVGKKNGSMKASQFFLTTIFLLARRNGVLLGERCQ